MPVTNSTDETVTVEIRPPNGARARLTARQAFSLGSAAALMTAPLLWAAAGPVAAPALAVGASLAIAAAVVWPLARRGRSAERRTRGPLQDVRSSESNSGSEVWIYPLDPSQDPYPDPNNFTEAQVTIKNESGSTFATVRFSGNVGVVQCPASSEGQSYSVDPRNALIRIVKVSQETPPYVVTLEDAGSLA